MKTHPPAQTFGRFEVGLRVQWLEAKRDPLSRLDAVIDWECFRPLLVQVLAKPAKVPGADRTGRRFHVPVMKGFYLRYIGRRRNAAAIGLNLIYSLARYEQIVQLKLRPRNAV